MFGLEDHEVSLKASMVQPVVQNSRKDLTKGDTMTDSQVAFRCKFDGWHGGTRSMYFGPNEEF